MIRQFRRATAVTAASTLVASGLALTAFTPAAHAAPAQCVTPSTAVTLFGFNDFHGRIAAAAKLFTVVEDARAALGEDKVMLVSTGDDIGASTFESMINDDTPVLDILNAIDLDSSTVGNHEFDKGWSDLTGRVVPKSQFPHLGANVYKKGTTTVAAPLKEYEIFEKGGVKIAVVGAVTADTPSVVSPAGVATLDFGDPVAAVNRVAAQLRDGNTANGEADIVIASIHEGAPNGGATPPAAPVGAWARIFNGLSSDVSLVLNGHTHQEYSWKTANGIPVVQAGSYGAKLARVVLSIDGTNGGVCDVTSTIVAPAAAAGTSARIVKINEIVAAANAEADRLGAEVIGTATEAISTPAGNADVRNQESPMVNAVAEMFYDKLSNGDPEFIGLQNAGGTRDSFDKGDITYREAALTLPFANSLFTTQITGAQFKIALEQQWQRNAAGQVPSRPFLSLGLSKNVSYTFDESLPEGQRITSVRINGKPIDPAKLYTVGSGSFLIAGGDNFRELGKGVNTRDTGRADLEAWVEWVREQGTMSPDYTLRGVPAKTDDGVLKEGGDALTFTFGAALAGGVAPQTLDMGPLTPSGSTPPTKVSPKLANRQIKAYIGDTQVGSGAVRDGVGTVSVWLPKGTSILSGTYDLRFVVLESGTEIRWPVTVQTDAKPPVDPPTPEPEFKRTAPYTLAGIFPGLNGRDWRTYCEPYSKTERCRTEIWATVVVYENGKYVHKTGWHFNNLTYLPFMTRAQWKSNLLANPGTHTNQGREWLTECDTARTGKNACRSYIKATVVVATPLGDGKYSYKMENKFVFNNIVMFKAK